MGEPSDWVKLPPVTLSIRISVGLALPASLRVATVKRTSLADAVSSVTDTAESEVLVKVALPPASGVPSSAE